MPLSDFTTLSKILALFENEIFTMSLFFSIKSEKIQSIEYIVIQKVKYSLEVPGFEPGAFRMRSGHSTTELHPLSFNAIRNYILNRNYDSLLQ